jgi:hypothetical protein
MQRLIRATALSLACLSAHADEQLRSVTPFQAVSVNGPVSLTVEAGKAYSLKVTGNKTFITRITHKVVDGELRLGFKDSSHKGISSNERIVVTMPELHTFKGEGAGEMLLKNIKGERLDVHYMGAGRLAIDGQVQRLHLRAKGVGEVDAKALIAQEADVTFEGIGDVSIHAKQKLNASVRGIGNLSYYGNPPVVNKTVSGIGSVVAVK